MSQKKENCQGLSRVLICGLGNIGRRHLRVLRQDWPLLDIALLRSGHGPVHQELTLASHLFTTLDAALAWKPEAAVIATPATDHLKKALILAKHDIPLLIEKPIGTGSESPVEWQKLLELSHKIPILIGYVFRHDPCGSFIKNLLKEKKLGKLIEADFYCGSWLPEWRPEVDYRDTVSSRKDLGGGALLELSHELDLAQWLLGSIRIDSTLLRQSGLLEIDVEDQATILACNVDGVTVSIRLNFCTRPSRRTLSLRGSLGEIQWNLIEGNIQASQMNGAQIPVFTSTVSADERYNIQMNHFLSCAMGIEAPKCSIEDGLKVLQLVNQARLKSQGIIVQANA